MSARSLARSAEPGETWSSRYVDRQRVETADVAPVDVAPSATPQPQSVRPFVDALNHEFVWSGATEDTYDAAVHYIRVGEDGSFILGDDFYEYLRAHITANDLGVVTAFDVRTNDMPCQ